MSQEAVKETGEETEIKLEVNKKKICLSRSLLPRRMNKW